MALYPCRTAGGGLADFIEDGYAIFNNSYINLSSPTSPVSAAIFANVSKFSLMNMSVSGSAAYSDTKLYSYDPATHQSTQITSAYGVNLSNVDYLLINKYAATVLSFS